MRVSSLTAVFLVLVVLPLPARAQVRRSRELSSRAVEGVPYPAASVAVHGNDIIRTVPAWALGSNIQFGSGGDGILDTSTGELRAGAVEELARLHLGILRFPGGSLSQSYHWRDGVGPRAERPASIGYFDGSELANDYGTDEHLQLCKRLAAVASITVNFETGTPQEAANWVEYVNGEVPADAPDTWTTTSWPGDAVAPSGYFAWLRSTFGHPAPYEVARWEVGNEVYDNWGAMYSAAAYAERFVDFARAMKAVDPSIQVAAVGYERADQPWKEGDDPWNATVAGIAGADMDALHVHTYTPCADGRTVALMTGGPVNFPFGVNRDGTYALSFLARGIDLLGPYPLPDGTVAMLRVAVDGSTVEDVPLDRPLGGFYTVSTDLTAGSHTFGFELMNDVYDPNAGIDLNVLLDSKVTLDGPSGTNHLVLADMGNAARSAMAGSVVFGAEIAQIKKILSSETGRDDIELWVTEANTLYGLAGFGLQRAERMESATALAALALEELEAGASTVQQWSTLENRFFGFLTDARSLGRRASFPVWQLLGEMTGGDMVAVDTDSPTWDLDDPVTTMQPVAGIPALRAMAVRKDGRVNLLLLNTSLDTGLSVRIVSEGLPDEAEATVTTVSANSPEARDVNPEDRRYAFVSGIVGRSVTVDGSRPFWVPTQDRLEAAQGTVELWARPDFQPGDGRNHPLLSVGFSLHFGVSPEGVLAAYLPSENGSDIDRATTSVLSWSPGDWHHLALTWSPENLALFIDGSPVANTPRTALWTWIDPAQGMLVGTSIFQRESGWGGAVDELRLFNRERTASEIAEDASRGAAGSSLAPVPGTSALYHLDGSLVDTLGDERTKTSTVTVPMVLGSLSVRTPPASVVLVVMPPPGGG